MGLNQMLRETAQIMFPKKTLALGGEDIRAPLIKITPMCVPAGTLLRFCNSITRFSSEMFLQEHLDVFCTQFTCLHSNSSLHLKCDADYAAE